MTVVTQNSSGDWGYYTQETYTRNVSGVAAIEVAYTDSRTTYTGFTDVRICRPRIIYFKVDGLRPNTRHFVFFDKTNVTNYISLDGTQITDWNNAGRDSTLRVPGDKYLAETGFPTELGGPTGALYTDDDGSLEGLFYLQSNDTVNFPTGTRLLSFIDISLLDPAQALSYATIPYTADGGIENYLQTFYTAYRTDYVAYSYDVQDTRSVWVNTPAPAPPSVDRGSSGTTRPGPTVERSCFVAGTKVTMADGSVKNIEDVLIGEKLLGQDGVINTVVEYDHPMLDGRDLIGFNGGKPFMTPEHPLWTKQGWKSFSAELTQWQKPDIAHLMVNGDFEVGDEILMDDGSWFKIESVDVHKNEPEQQVFNFMLDGNNTYFADRLLAHNRGGYSAPSAPDTCTAADPNGDGSPSCFIAGTKVPMADGSVKNIEDVVVGDKLKGHNGTVNTVIRLDHTTLGNRKLYSFNNSGHFWFTSEHPFMTTDGWKSVQPEKTKEENEHLFNELVGALSVGDTLITSNGLMTIESIESKEINDPDLPLYNFNITGDHSYIADGYVVHNKGECFIPEARVLMADGTLKEIQHVVVGDKVMSWKGEVNTVIDTPRFNLGDNKIHGFNNIDPFVTSMHPIMTSTGWKNFDPEAYKTSWPEDYQLVASENDDGVIHKIEEGDEVAFYENGAAVYHNLNNVTIKEEAADFEVYNLILDGDHTFIVEGVVVHNKGCFTAESTVSMADGSFKSISDVKPGDIVWNKDKNEANTVLMIEKVPSNLFPSVYGPQGEKPFATINHPIWVGDQYVSGHANMTDNLHPWLAKVYGKPKQLENMAMGPIHGEHVYNLWLDGDGTYVVNGYGTTSIVGDGGVLRSGYERGYWTAEQAVAVTSNLMKVCDKRTMYGFYVINNTIEKINFKPLSIFMFNRAAKVTSDSSFIKTMSSVIGRVALWLDGDKDTQTDQQNVTSVRIKE